MNTTETQQQIPSSSEFVLAEAQKIRYLYGLRDVIRYKQTRLEDIYTQSVAEHTHNLQLLAQYFLLLEDPQSKLDAKNLSSD